MTLEETLEKVGQERKRGQRGPNRPLADRINALSASIERMQARVAVLLSRQEKLLARQRAELEKGEAPQ